MLPLATDSSSVFWIAVGAFLALCLLALLIRPRDVNGRKRAGGCIVGLVIFFAPLVGFLAVWFSKHVF